MNVHHPPDYSSIPQDSIILEHYGINELNFETIKKYREIFSEIKPNHPWSGLEIKEFLYKIGAWGKVRNTNEEGLTLAGLLMFSEERIITEVLPQYFLEYRENTMETLDEDWSKRFTSQDGTWSGNVLDFYFKTRANLTAGFHDLDQYSDSQLTNTVSIFSFQEAIINALVHADYYGEGGIVIEREKDLLRFSNPGLLRIPVEQALEGNISNLRNPNLFKMFILIGLCKRTGSGLKSIKASWDHYGDNAFGLIQDAVSERTILTFYTIQNTLKKEELELLIENDRNLFPKEDEQFMENFDDIDNSFNNESDSLNSDADSYNKEVNSCNKGKNSFNIDYNSYNKEVNSYNSGQNSLNSDVNSCNKEGAPIVDYPNSYNSEKAIAIDEKTEVVGNYVVLIDEVEKEEVAEQSTSEGIESKLWEISELARKKKRLSPNVMEDIIVKLCAHAQKPLMLRELAALLERTPDGLRNNYLAKLLDKGKLRLKYPDQVNHPKQAYIIVEKQGG